MPKIRLSVTADCGSCDWTAGPETDMAAVFRLAERHTRAKAGHPTCTTGIPASNVAATVPRVSKVDQ